MKDPRDAIDLGRMSTLQIIVVIITVFLNGIDGFDVLSISFAAPGITREWGIDPAALGIVMSMELFGMAIGSFFLGGIADRFGRRPTLLGCLAVMTVGMFMVTTAGGPLALSIWRVLIGLGIGGILAANNAVVAEFSNIRRRGFCISLMVIGYPLGGTFGGMVASRLLATHDWRAIFYFGGILTGILLVVTFFWVPESVHWLTRKQPEKALEKINKVLSRLKSAPVSALPVMADEEGHGKAPVPSIFSGHLSSMTWILTLAYFLHITTFYFILKWSPKIVADMGFAPSQAGGVLVWANMGGALGASIFGFLTSRFELKKLTILILTVTTIFVGVFGTTGPELGQIKFLAALAGFFGNAGISGLYSILAVAYPTAVRATGTGFAIGVGRAGAVLSPIAAGILFQADMGLHLVAPIMGLGSLLGGAVLLLGSTKILQTKLSR